LNKCQELQIFACVYTYLDALLLLLLLLLLFITTFMQGIYKSVPETNHVSKVYSFAVILYIQFVLHLMLFSMLNVLCFNISTFHSKCAVPKIAVFFIFP